MFPIGYDPFGNLILLSVKGSDRSKVYFWDHDWEVEDGIEPDYSNLTLIADSFDEFIHLLKSIDLSELIRIFGENKVEQNRETKCNTADTQSYNIETENFYLKQENERLVRSLQRTEAQVDQLLVSLQEQSRQLCLTHAQPSRSFWQRLWQK